MSVGFQQATFPPRGEVSPTGLLVTVDVEGDNLWSRPKNVGTRNARFLPRFQEVCERHDLRPTYLTSYEMACCREFQSFARDVLRRDACEIGMHLHAWNSPPLFRLTGDDSAVHPYLTEYPEEVIRQKIAFLTNCLEDAFGVEMTSHRAGRWGFNDLYACIILEAGYRVDTSVTPFVSWRKAIGDPKGQGGPDYSEFPSAPYFVSPTDIRKEGHTLLLEVPVSTERIAIRDGVPADAGPNPHIVKWLRPTGRNLAGMQRLVERGISLQSDCVVMAIHSSELMPGGSPSFPRAEDVEKLYDDLERLFRAARGRTQGMTLTEFYHQFRRNRGLG